MRVIIALILLTGICFGEDIKLWPNGNPEGWKIADKEMVTKRGGVTRVSKVNTPILIPFIPKEKKSDAAVIICPGGGYNILAIDLEGSEIAKWFNSHGITAFVLKYRLPRRGIDKVRHKAALQDAQRAISIIRSKAAYYKISKDKIGIMGFSAGGHLTAVTSTAPERTYKAVDDIDKISCLPNFSILIYPAYLANKKTMQLNPPIKITAKTPKAFLLHTQDDGQPVENSIAYFLACKNNKVPVHMHIYPKGPHGYGMRKKGRAVDAWPERLLEWIKSAKIF